MHGSIPDASDEDRFVEDDFSNRLLEGGFMQQRTKVVLVREAER
jgi:hypothetical protein